MTTCNYEHFSRTQVVVTGRFYEFILESTTPFRENISHNSEQQHQHGLEINFIHHDLSNDSTESRSIATRSSSASLPSPGKSLEQIARYLAHESPIADAKNLTHRTPEKVNESFNVSLDQIQANTNSIDQPEQSKLNSIYMQSNLISLYPSLI